MHYVRQLPTLVMRSVGPDLSLASSSLTHERGIVLHTILSVL
jgi:hypothetical protein